MIYAHVLTISDLMLKVLDFSAVQINEVVVIEGWINIERVKRTSFNEFARTLS